jgi:hypothetical protein
LGVEVTSQLQPSAGFTSEEWDTINRSILGLVGSKGGSAVVMKGEVPLLTKFPHYNGTYLSD